MEYSPIGASQGFFLRSTERPAPGDRRNLLEAGTRHKNLVKNFGQPQSKTPSIGFQPWISENLWVVLYYKRHFSVKVPWAEFSRRRNRAGARRVKARQVKAREGPRAEFHMTVFGRSLRRAIGKSFLPAFPGRDFMIYRGLPNRAREGPRTVPSAGRILFDGCIPRLSRRYKARGSMPRRARRGHPLLRA